MQLNELDALIDKTATLMAQYERHAGRIDARLQAVTDAMQDVLRGMPEAAGASARTALESLAGEAGDAVRQGIARPLDDYHRALARAGARIDGAAHALTGQIGQLRRLQRALVWKTLAAAAFTLALLLGGGAWLSLHYARVVRDNQMAAELLRAYDRADVVLCGKGELCANVDAKRARYGDHAQYVPVRPR